MWWACKWFFPFISLVTLLVRLVSPLLGSSMVLELPPCSHTPCLPAPATTHKLYSVSYSNCHKNPKTFSWFVIVLRSTDHCWGFPRTEWELTNRIPDQTKGAPPILHSRIFTSTSSITETQSGSPLTQSLNPEEPSLLKGKTLALLRRERRKKRKKKPSLCFILEFQNWRNKVNIF